MQKLSSRRSTFLSFQPPAVGPEEVAAVTETLTSGWLTSGPRAELLEQRIAELTGARHCVALASGTAALHLALVGLGIASEDEVITTPITWPATADRLARHDHVLLALCDQERRRWRRRGDRNGRRRARRRGTRAPAHAPR